MRSIGRISPRTPTHPERSVTSGRHGTMIETSTEHSEPTVSAAICTRNRPDKIRTAVESVLSNVGVDFDLVVIDQSTDDQTQTIVESIATTDPRLRYVRMSEAGLSRAYNRAIAETEGDVLACTDDDCIAPSDWLRKIVDAFASEPDGELLYGQVVAAYEHDGGVSLTPALHLEEPERLSKEDGFKVWGMGANYAARRSLFRRIGGFDEILGGGGPLKSSQDFDLAYRAYQGGATILLRPEVVIRHDGRREHEDWPALKSAYGFGDGAFYMKHVRCHDLYATWLFASRWTHDAARAVAKRALRRQADFEYITGMLKGAKGSFDFEVDRRARMYVDPRPSTSSASPTTADQSASR